MAWAGTHFVGTPESAGKAWLQYNTVRTPTPELSCYRVFVSRCKVARVGKLRFRAQALHDLESADSPMLKSFTNLTGASLMQGDC